MLEKIFMLSHLKNQWDPKLWLELTESSKRLVTFVLESIKVLMVVVVVVVMVVVMCCFGNKFWAVKQLECFHFKLALLVQSECVNRSAE